MVLILKGAEQDVDEAIRGADAGVDSVMFTKCYSQARLGLRLCLRLRTAPTFTPLLN